MRTAAARFGLIWRLVRRGTVLTRAQAVLITALVALPVLGGSGAALVVQSRNASDAEAIAAYLGHNASRVQQVSMPDPSLRQDPAGSANWTISYDAHGNAVHQSTNTTYVSISDALPAGTRVLRVADSTLQVDSKNGVADLPVTLGAVWDPAFRERLDVVKGRAPRSPHELMVTSATLARLGVQLGDQVHLDAPVSGDWTITGLIHDRRTTDSTAELFLPDGAFAGTSAAPGALAYTYYLPELDIDATRRRHGRSTMPGSSSSRAAWQHSTG